MENIPNPISEIMAIRQQVQSSEPIDSEPSDIDEILNQLKENKISPEEALEKARGIRDSMQSYH